MNLERWQGKFANYVCYGSLKASLISALPMSDSELGHRTSSHFFRSESLNLVSARDFSSYNTPYFRASLGKPDTKCADSRSGDWESLR
jgi:hypothetical protein